MKKSEKATRIHDILEDLYPDPPIPLDHRDPFTLLIAVMLSAQTTDARVNMVTPGLFKRASTARRMAKLPVETVLKEIRTCGLAPGKSKNAVALSKMLVDRHGGEVPEDIEALEELPGVGHKTASVVMAQAFGHPAFPVDTHIHRLAARWGLSDGKTVERTEADLKAVFPRETWSKLHLKIILFGRDYCPALRHDLAKCEICGWAASRKRIAEEKAKNAPKKKASKKKKKKKKKATASTRSRRSSLTKARSRSRSSGSR